MRRPTVSDRLDRPVLNVPNAITAVRTIVSMALAVYALTEMSVAIAVAAYACYWAGDILDGMAARLLRQETRAGAVFDIVADRACGSLCAATLLAMRPAAALPIAIFLIQFMVLDCLLSLTFLRWPILGPNDFGVVHRQVYRWNWSPPAKAINTGGLVVLVLIAPSPVWPTAFALAVVLVKALSLGTVSRLGGGPIRPS